MAVADLLAQAARLIEAWTRAVDAVHPDARIRLAEPLAALSLATGLGLGQPLERALGVCLAVMGLADCAGCSDAERSEVF